MNGDRTDTPQPDLPFDRLVDGELGERERRELLVRLDSEPGGWRRCALRFLESQCWKESLSDGIRNSEFAVPIAQHARPSDRSPQPRIPDPSETVSAATRWAGRFGTVVAMAASFFVALWLGSLAHRPGLAPSGGAIGVGRPGEMAKTSSGVEAGASPWRWVTVSGQGDGSQGAVQVPAMGRGSIDEQWLSSMPPVIPDDVLQALDRTGHRVQQRRQFVPMPLDDGRQLIVPVDQIEVHYVGNGTY